MPDTDGDVIAYCTGTWVSNDIILTASHCVEVFGRMASGAEEGTPYDPEGDPIAFLVKEDIDISIILTPVEKFRYARVIKADTDNDIALVRVYEPFLTKHSVMNTRCDPVLDIGSQVHTVSNMQGFTWSYSKGYIAAIRKYPFDGKIRDYVQIAFDGNHGSSGAAAVDDNGCMIGVVTTMVSNRTLFSVDTVTVKHLLQAVKELN